MSIPENKACKTKHKSPEQAYPGRYVIPESEIRDLVRELLIEQIDTFAAQMQIIADATKQPVEGAARNKLVESELEQIRQVATQDKRKQHQNVMKAILLAVERGGREGIDVTHRTALYAVRLAFEWTPEYLFALRQYADKVRSISQKAKSKI